MNDALKIERTETKTYLVPERDIPDHVSDKEEFAKSIATANDIEYRKGTSLDNLDVENVELCSACRDPTDRTVPLESGHDAPFCKDCEEKHGGGE
jgi:hypothetical protein